LPYEKLPADSVRRLWCSAKFRSDAHRVLENYAQPPHFDEKSSPASIKEASAQIFDCVEDCKSSFTLMCYAFGPEVFDKEKIWVYRYGREGNFAAIISTTDEFSLFGLKRDDDDKLVVAFEPALKVENEKDYYGRIVFENNFKNASFLSPTAHFSPISNVPVIKTKGMILEETDAFTAEELYGDEGEGWQDDDDDDNEGGGSSSGSDSDGGDGDHPDEDPELGGGPNQDEPQVVPDNEGGATATIVTRVGEDRAGSQDVIVPPQPASLLPSSTVVGKKEKKTKVKKVAKDSDSSDDEKLEKKKKKPIAPDSKFDRKLEDGDYS